LHIILGISSHLKDEVEWDSTKPNTCERWSWMRV